MSRRRDPGVGRAATVTSPLEGKVAIVTGAGRRVGRTIALALAGRGMRIAVHYNASRAGAEETVAMIAELGSTAVEFEANLADAEAAPPLIAGVIARFGRLDLVVNSAASMTRTPFGKISAGEWDGIMALNLRAPAFVAQAAVSPLAAQAGSIVNIGDHMGEEPWPGFLAHGVAKAAVVALTRHLAVAMAPHVRVNCVVPGTVLAPEGMGEASLDRIARSTPLQRLGSPNDVAGAVLYLAEAPFVTGEVIHVDGGRHVRR
ncbi:MAG: SDR family oxidoreductase [Gemmatimonadetes bacterium]|nr:SDR family oxidoreductase [Gemmatimonadota bacterium]